ncbi:MAG: PhnD/SsuA/transferrin family substrate-binding protein [Methylococcales bacterium]
MISDILEVKSGNCERSGDYLFECKGCIDVRANPVLEVLREVPQNSRVLLDFKQVERVNSMGLSLLLKIFQEWKKNGTRVEVYNLNKMVGILFKITGLGSYVMSGDLADVVKTAVAPALQQAPIVANLPKVPSQEILEHTDYRNTAISPAVSSIKTGATLRFAANISNSFHRGGWFALTTFMQQQLKTAIRFEQCMDIAQITGKQVDLFYANPFFACSLMQSKELIPVARTNGNTEQVVVLGHAESRLAISAFRGARVTTASADSLVFLLGRKMCDYNGLNSSDLTYSYSGNEIKAIQNLVKKRADLAFISRQTYDGLSSFSRNSVSLRLMSQVSFSHPLFCIAPHINGMKGEFQEILLSMNRSEEGRKILNNIKIDGWHPSESEKIDRLKDLFRLYVKH